MIQNTTQSKMTAKVIWIFLSFTVALATAFETQIIDAKVGKLQTQTVNSSVQFIFHFRNVVDSGLRVHTYSAKAEEDQPVIFTVRQEKGLI